VQGFLASLLSGSAMAGVDRERGRFRSYLLGALRHFLANERARASTLRRGGGQAPLPLTIDRDDATVEIPDDRTPEGAYAYAWAMEILRRTRKRLEERYAEEGRSVLFETLSPFLLDGDTPRYREVAARLSMTEAHARVAVHRLRTAFGAALRAEVADTVASDAEIDDELRAVIDAIRG
jgi:RNA polymerase sigma-70 factor (ECF subfamily)